MSLSNSHHNSLGIPPPQSLVLPLCCTTTSASQLITCRRRPLRERTTRIDFETSFYADCDDGKGGILLATACSWSKIHPRSVCHLQMMRRRLSRTIYICSRTNRQRMGEVGTVTYAHYSLSPGSTRDIIDRCKVKFIESYSISDNSDNSTWFLMLVSSAFVRRNVFSLGIHGQAQTQRQIPKE